MARAGRHRAETPRRRTRAMQPCARDLRPGEPAAVTSPGLLIEIDLVDGQRLLREHRSDTEPHLVDYIERSQADDKAHSQSLGARAVAGRRCRDRARTPCLWRRLDRPAEATRSRVPGATGAGGPVADCSPTQPPGHLTDGNVSRRAGHHRTKSSRTGNSPAARSARGDQCISGGARSRRIELAVLSGHAVPVAGAAFSPDGRRIVTASDDHTARIWDAATAGLLAVLSGHDGSRDLRGVLGPTGCASLPPPQDKTARIWDAATARQLAVLSGHGDAVTFAAFSPDGRRIVTASDDRTARIWDAATAQLLAVLSGHDDADCRARRSRPTGVRIITASADQTARIWDAVTARQLAVLSGQGDDSVPPPRTPPRTHPTGRRIVTASGDRTARIWDAATAQPITVLSHGDAGPGRLHSRPMDRRIVTASEDRTARIWDAATAKQLAVLAGHQRTAYRNAAFSPDGRRIVTASFDQTAQIWDAASGMQLAVLARSWRVRLPAPPIRQTGSASSSRLSSRQDPRRASWDAASGQCRSPRDLVRP